jgi:hypothetical protein
MSLTTVLTSTGPSDNQLSRKGGASHRAPMPMGTVSDEAFRTYLTVFHETYLETVGRFILDEFSYRLGRFSLLPAQITGYISTQKGVAFEYGERGPLTFEIRKSSRPVEELIFASMPGVGRARSVGMAVTGGGSLTWTGGRVIDCFPPVDVRGSGSRATIQDMTVRRRGYDWVQHVRWAEIYWDRDAAYWTRELAVARAKDDVLQALTDVEQMRRRSMDVSEYLATYRQRRVLLLGDFDSAGRFRLQILRAALEQRGYVGTLADEIGDIPDYDLRQKVSVLGGLSRFILADDSSKSGHLAELAWLVPQNWLIVIMREKGSARSYMLRGTSGTSSNVLELEYEVGDVTEVMSHAVEWAEHSLDERKRHWDEVYPWRSDTH